MDHMEGRKEIFPEKCFLEHDSMKFFKKDIVLIWVLTSLCSPQYTVNCVTKFSKIKEHLFIKLLNLD